LLYKFSNNISTRNSDVKWTASTMWQYVHKLWAINVDLMQVGKSYM